MLFITSRTFVPNLVRSQRQRRVRGFFLVLFFAAYYHACAPSRSVGQGRHSPLVERRVERVLREYEQKTATVGLAFGMVQSGSAVLECYAGFASKDKGVPVDSTSVFHWASMSKGLTAVCAMKMVEQGQLDLDADIEKYIPELKLQAPIALRKLLDHQSGIGGYEDYPELLELSAVDRKMITQESILKRMIKKDPVFEPGTLQGYSSPGYILLSIAMERASKKSFSEIVDELVAKPLNLSSLRVGGTSDADVVRYRFVNGKRGSVDDWNDDWRLGAGAVKSNLPDALAFASALIQSSLLTPTSSKELFKRRSRVVLEGEGKMTMAATYGFMRVGDQENAPIAIPGNQPGAKSLLMIYPREQMATIMFGNTTPVNLLEIQLAVMKAIAEDR